MGPKSHIGPITDISHRTRYNKNSQTGKQRIRNGKSIPHCFTRLYLHTHHVQDKHTMTTNELLKTSDFYQYQPIVLRYTKAVNMLRGTHNSTEVLKSQGAVQRGGNY